MMLQSMKNTPSLCISLNNCVTRPSFKNQYDTFWSSGQRCQKCVYIWKVTSTGRAENQNITTTAISCYILIGVTFTITLITVTYYVVVGVTCTICNKVYATQQSLNSHTRREHLSKLVSITCETCGKVLRDKSKWICYHLYLYSNIEQFN